MKRLIGMALVLALASAMRPVDLARAHATLVGSEPESGSVVPETPDEVRLIFDIEIDPELSSAELVNATGSTIATGDADLNDPDRLSIVIDMPDEVPPGEYTATYVVVEADEPEQHEVEGEVTFSIDPTAPAAASPTVVLDAPQGTVVPDTAADSDNDDDGGIGRGTLIVGGVAILVALAVIATIGRRRYMR